MIHDELLELDARNRERAIEPGSFIVEAPAGAGKTELLTQRYLKLLAIVDEPEEIVAITFTNKAAAEMSSRILTSLQDAHDNKPIDKQHKERTRELAKEALKRSDQRGWNLLQQPARLRIQTIDALSSLLARQMPLMSRFGAQPAIVEDAAILYEEAASRALASLETEGGGPAKIALEYFDNDVMRLQKQLAVMLGRRDQWLLHAGQQSVADESAAALRHLIQHDIDMAATVLHEDIQRKLMPVARYAASNLTCEHGLALLLDWESPIPPRHESISLWLSVCDFLLTRDGDFRKEGGINIKLGIPATDEGRGYKKALAEIIAMLPDAVPLAKLRKLPDPASIDSERPIVDALATLLKLAAAHLVNVFQESGEVDFVEVAQRALFALEDQSGPTDLALRLDYRIRHLLVDEFQDTSPTQVKLLQKLTSGWEPGDGRTLFCVGDPMQSIYRFRKADVGLFLQIAEFGMGHLPLERLKLTRNNRSCPAIIDWVNQAFAEVLPAHDSVSRGAISYREFAATRDSLAGEGVIVHPLIAGQGTKIETLAVLEAQRIADTIEQERVADPARSIAVLVRARSHLHALVAEIRRNRPQLRFQAVEVEALAGRQSVQDVLALAHALIHRADRVNWLAILRAPWCGMTLADLHALAADDQRSTIWQLMQDEARLLRLSADGRQRLMHVRQILAEALANQGRQTVRRWIESTWLKLGGPLCLWDSGDVRDVQALLDLIDQLDAGGRFDIATLEESVSKLYAAPDVHADGSLQFMTIHKAKGLEFDTVILPGLHRQPPRSDAPLILWEEIAIDEAAPQLIAAPWCPKHLRHDEWSAYDYLQDLECERSANEMTRVLYVAATRAIRRLHLTGAVKRDGKDEIKPPSGTFLAMLWDKVGGDFLRAAEEAVPVTIEASLDESVFVPRLIRLTAPAVPAAFMPNTGLANSGYGETATNNAEELQTTSKLDRDTGILAHRYMELIAREGMEAWPISGLEALMPFMMRWLESQGYAKDAATQGAGRVMAVLRTALASEDGRWVLRKRENSAYELAVARSDNETISTHIVDRTFVDSGVRWIIDYKTVGLTENIPSAGLIDVAQRYRLQLERYAMLFNTEGLPVKKAVFFLALGKLVELD